MVAYQHTNNSRMNRIEAQFAGCENLRNGHTTHGKQDGVARRYIDSPQRPPAPAPLSRNVQM